MHEFFIWFFVLLCFEQPVGAFTPFRDHQYAINSTTDWSSIEPSEKLVYHDCYDDAAKGGAVFKCARLLLPLDWHNTSNPNRIALAVIKLTARNHHKDHQNRYDSKSETVFWNPGGPGRLLCIAFALHLVRRILIACRRIRCSISS